MEAKRSNSQSWDLAGVADAAIHLPSRTYIDQYCLGCSTSTNHSPVVKLT